MIRPRPELETFAGIFCAPSRQQLETGDLADFYHPENGALSSTFDRLWEISEVDDTAISAKNGNLKPVLIDVIWRIKSKTKAGERL